MTVTNLTPGTVDPFRDDDALYELASGAPDPFLERDGCPRWCVESGTHRPQLFPADRTHYGVERVMPLELVAMRPAARDDVGGRVFAGPAVLSVSLEHNYRECEPRVALAIRARSTDDAPYYLTTSEAVELAAMLTAAVDDVDDDSEALSLAIGTDRAGQERHVDVAADDPWPNTPLNADAIAEADADERGYVL